MKYPIFIHRDSRYGVIAVCSFKNELYGVGDTLESALSQLREKFVCRVHDPEAELEIIPLAPERLAALNDHEARG